METLDVRRSVMKFFDEKGWKYEYKEDRDILVAGFKFSGRVRSAELYVDFSYSDCYLVTCPLSMEAPEESYPELLRLINHINYRSKFGNFEMDEDDGEIRFRMAVYCEEDLPSEKMIERSIKVPLTMVRNHSEDIVAIMMGHKTFEEVTAES